MNEGGVLVAPSPKKLTSVKKLSNLLTLSWLTALGLLAERIIWYVKVKPANGLVVSPE
jgi:hypothetical protein